MKPFTPTVWYFLLATSVTLLLVFYFLMKFNKHFLDIDNDKGFLWLLFKGRSTIKTRLGVDRVKPWN